MSESNGPQPIVTLPAMEPEPVELDPARVKAVLTQRLTEVLKSVPQARLFGPVLSSSLARLSDSDALGIVETLEDVLDEIYREP